jgi:DNA-directed RNA polymerase specialized sigma24 family protein
MAIPRSAVRAHYQRVASLRLLMSRELALERQLAGTIVRLGRRAASAYATDSAILVSYLATPLTRVLRPSLRETARAFGALIGEKGIAYGLERKAFDIDADTEAYIDEHVATRVSQISDSLRDQIREVVRQGLAEGLGTEEIAAAIEEATAGELAMARARRIARTETHTASMVGQFGAAQASPLQWRKTWLATEDKRTRESHVEANGQERALDEPFEVGEAQLMFPGDPDGPPGEIINCRCTMTLDPIPL